MPLTDVDGASKQKVARARELLGRNTLITEALACSEIPRACSSDWTRPIFGCTAGGPPEKFFRISAEPMLRNVVDDGDVEVA